MKHAIVVLGLLLCAGLASAQQPCVSIVSKNSDPNDFVNSGPVHNMAFTSSNNPTFYTTPDASQVLYFPGAKWIKFGADFDAGYVKLGPNWIANGGCPRVWRFDPISMMQLRKGSSLIWSAGPLFGGNINCTDNSDSDDSVCYFGIFSAGSAVSPQIAVNAGDVLYAYDCFYAEVTGTSPQYAYNTGSRCGMIKLVVQ